VTEPDRGDVLEPFVSDPDFTLYVADVRDVLPRLPSESIDCCVTSPPYWGLRDYGADGQLGLEPSPDEYVAALVAVFADVRRALTAGGTLWLNLGDSYNAYNGNRGETGSTLEGRRQHQVGRPHVPTGSGLTAPGLKSKDLVGIPWRVAFALQADGWYLRSDIIWAKPNPMPESVTDRPTKSHEYVFLLTKSPRYWFDADAVREKYRDTTRDVPVTGLNGGAYAPPGQTPHSNARGPDGRRVTRVLAASGSIQHRDGERWPNDGRNIRSVWEIATQPYPDAHFATYPEELVRRCILAGCPHGGTVLDPFMGSGTTALVARKHGRKAVGVELNPEYAAMAARRLGQQSLLAEGAT
jgi:DNA modification methylase